MKTKRRTFASTNSSSNLCQSILFQINKLILITLLCNELSARLVQAISIKPADFDRLIMPCYTGAPSSSYSSASFQQQPLAQNSPPLYPAGANQAANNLYQAPRIQPNPAGYQAPSYYGGESSTSFRQSSSSFSSQLGQQIPRANTIDNFIALVSKIEAANPRLAGNPDQLIRTLLGRFRLDNYYYDVRSRTSISDQDHRITDIIPALLNYTLTQQQFNQPQPYPSYDDFPEHLLDHDEKCSMYFMLSHFIVKETPSNPPLASISVPQLAGPLAGQRPPSLQAAGSGYPAQSASSAFGAAGTRFAGPSPSFGSPQTNNMNSFGAGLTNQPEYSGNNPYGVNVVQPNSQYNQNFNNIRNNAGQFAGTGAASRYATPVIDGNGRSRDERQAIEYGVVAVAQQENAAVSLNRVLMGILAANIYPQEIKQLAPIVFPNQFLAPTSKLNEDIDPLYAVSLADLWAISSIPRAGKAFDFKLLGDNGHWNSTMCPTSFILDRANSIKFTTAELLGGLDAFNLGMVRRELLVRNKNVRLSDLLRMYYSKSGFRPQFAEYSVCSRGTAINNRLDEIRRQADNYLRLYQLNIPSSDNDLALHILKLDSFKELLKSAAVQYSPAEVCQESSYNDVYPSDMLEQCEIGKADVITVLDSSQQANEVFMNLVVNKLAQRIGLSRTGNSLTILTNQQDSTGYAGSYSFNAIVRNSTNTAEIGCSLSYDSSSSYQGGQITEPTRLVEMFERALVNLDTEYLVRQNMGTQGSTSSPTSGYNNKPSSYISSLFGQSDGNYLISGLRPKNTAGSKVIIWFNYGSQPKPAPLSSGPTNWNGVVNPNSDQNQYRFYEAKRYLRENFRSAAILAISTSRDEVKAFVDDESRDIFTDIPPPDGGTSSSFSSDYSYPGSSAYAPNPSSQMDPATVASLNGPADILVGKLVQRMCEIPAVFQYPLCFKTPSENVMSVGYISPKRKQNWMMSPKTFFASRTVRMAFKVDGGRLRVCFGRMAKPDESAAKNPQQNIYHSSPIILGQSQAGSGGQYATPAPAVVSSGSNYYTGLDYGICKDVSPGQEIDFIVDDPCYKKAIVDCMPFYFVVKEITNPGEGDQNYMCKDPGCKRFDQVKFVMTHTGVSCNSAFKSIKANWLLIMISIVTTACLTNNSDIKQTIKHLGGRQNFSKSFLTIVLISFSMVIKQAQAQLSAPADFGQGRYGEKRGNLTPSEILAIILLIMTILAGLALAIGLCYYVNKRNSRGSSRLGQDDY